jgi:hypothetical protein
MGAWVRTERSTWFRLFLTKARDTRSRARARFAKFLSYVVLMDDKVPCKNLRCRKMVEISGVKTTAFI